MKAFFSANRFFSLENPEMSWMWVQLVVQKLYRLPGVAFVKFLFKDFGVPFYKPTLILHNCPTFHKLA